MQHLDIPKENIKDDKLNFAPFANKVAQGILNYSQQETLIFAIEGQWGSGKTTLINFIKRDIEDETIILHFNPWLIVDIEVLVEQFLDELLKTIINNSWKVKALEEVLPELKKTFKSYIRTIVKIIPDINIKGDIGFFKVDSTVNLSSLAKKLEDNTQELTLYELKEKINGYLDKLGTKKIVIIVDDIDRLTDKETEFVFRLTKGIADFNNLIYILLYDKTIVSKSLQTFKQEDGEKYLEKIVQYSLSVPKAHNITLQKLIFEKLDQILSKLDQDDKTVAFDKEKWSSFIHKIFSQHIQTIRDINKVINVMSFEYPIIAEDVNFTDFFLISLIKIQNNELYEFIKNNPLNFFRDPHSFGEKDKEEKVITENFENNLKQFHQSRDILVLLFPVLQKEEDLYGYGNETKYKDHTNKYLSDMFYFENYFSFAMSDDKLSYQEYKIVENFFLGSDYNLFELEMIKLDQEQKGMMFVDMFVQIKLDKLEENNDIKNAFLNAIKVAQKLKEGHDGVSMSWTFINPTQRFLILAYHLLKKINVGIDDFILEFYNKDSDVPLLIKIDLFHTIRKKIKDNDYEKLNITEHTEDKIYQNLKSLLNKLTIKNILSSNNDNMSIYLISRFETFELSLNELSEEFKKYIFESKENFFHVLKSFKYLQLSSEGNSYMIAKTTLELLISLEEIESYIKSMNKEDFSKEENELIKIWNEKSRF